MILCNSLEVSEILFCHEQPLFSYITNCIYSSCRICFVVQITGTAIHIAQYFFTAVLSFGKRCYFLYKANWIFGHSYSYWVLATVMLKSLSKFLPGKWPRALSCIHDSSSLACRNSYCVHHNVSNSLLPLTVFGVLFTFMFILWNRARSMRFHNFWCIRANS